ncbi:MAG: hypothetical protein K0R51_507 [Cytophagaceae bacterium]|jgi:hypothetical protein|nr:hypothetical protein [Cytophagaceae bacterium]
MIELLERNKALECNKNLASFIVDFQKVRYDPSVNDNLYKAGEIMYVEGGSEPRVITKEESDKWNKEAIDAYEGNRDHIETISIAQNFKGSVIYRSTPTAIHAYASHLAARIKELTECLNWESIIFLLDYSTPWLQQENDYEPVKRAMDYLRQLGMDKKFTGGIKASGSDQADFVEHLFWLTRCNGSLPTCYFSGIESHTVFSICKHGSVHSEFYSEEEKNNVRKVANRIGMIEIRDSHCDENFSETGSIEGRQIIV